MPDIATLPRAEAPPVLSTPDTRIFEQPSPSLITATTSKTDKELEEVYEVERTAGEIVSGGWTRVALQFPDELLVDAPRVSQALSRRIDNSQLLANAPSDGSHSRSEHDHVASTAQTEHATTEATASSKRRVKIFILADTSYGACCVDEVAAEHADADVVVHYGRACLSPTARLPVIYCFTQQPISQDHAVKAFCEHYSDTDEQIILMSDLPYQFCLHHLSEKLRNLGYHNLFITSIVQNAGSPLPNRTVPLSDSATSLQDWSLFHVSEPTPSLLLTLSSKVRSISFYPTDRPASTPQPALEATTSSALRRRYGLLTSLSTVPVFGILINTLSVRNYMEILRRVKSVIASAGKKSYTFVVGKVNAAKVANFSEVGGWVVIGCWESSLLEAKDFWKPIITPFELELALKDDNDRLWTGDWTSNFQALLDSDLGQKGISSDTPPTDQQSTRHSEEKLGQQRQMEDDDSEEESAPPEFDLRTGRYVSHSRPMRKTAVTGVSRQSADAVALTRRSRGDVLTMGEHFSPAANHLQNVRTWQGLGSDFESSENADGTHGATIEEGRHGIARGYTLEKEATPH